MNFFESLPKFRVDVFEYVSTDAIREVIPQETLDGMIVMAEQARINRKCDISIEKMYMIRLQHPPSPRLISVVFIEDMEGIRRNFIAYYDEIEHMLKKGFENGDIKKFSGSPF